MKTIDLSYLNVIALNTTCWAKHDPAAGTTLEPTLVAVVSINLRTLETAEKRSYLVKPRYAPVSDHCTRLTGVTPQMVENGIGYEALCEDLRLRFQSRVRPWAAYGTFPWMVFSEMSKKVRVDVPLAPRHFNLKHVTAVAFGLTEEVDLAKALELTEVPYYGHHNHAEDAAPMLADLFRFYMGRLRLTPMLFDSLARMSGLEALGASVAA